MGARYLSIDVPGWPCIDQQRWIAARNRVSFLEGARPARLWSPRTCRVAELCYGQFVLYQQQRGSFDPMLPPEVRATTQVLEGFLTQLRDRVAPCSVLRMGQAVQRMLAVMAPDHDWSWLNHVMQNIKRWARPVRDKRGHMVEPSQLYALGMQLMDTADDESVLNPYLRATMARDGLAIALLICAPVRLGNLASIELGRNLVRFGSRYLLTFTSDETKTSMPFEADLPQPLTERIETFVAVHRRSLLELGSTLPGPRLWINRWGKPMDPGGLRTQINRRTREAFGRHVWPHLFRTIAATGFVDHAPELVSYVPDLLGHAVHQTARKHYILANGAIAHTAVQSDFLRRREEAERRLREERRPR